MTPPELFLPPEWAPQAALWVGWPRLPEEWGKSFDGARAEIAGFVRAASRFEPVRVACGSTEALASARAHLGGVEGVDLVEVATGDIWLRDTGPIIARARGDGEALALCFRFNGWGGKYLMSGDTGTAAAIADHEGIAVRLHDFVLEGGAVDVDGAGQLLTTRQCMLNPNRNPGWDEARAEALLCAAFGVAQVIWLGDGLANDHTDGHVDNVARFIGPGHVLCQSASGSDDPNENVLAAIETDLRAAGLRVSTLPSPGRIEDDAGGAIAASHMNFTLVNGAVVLPTYEDRHSARAVAVLQDLFPAREIVALPARLILAGGGSFHCMSREIPRLPVNPDGAL